MLNTKFRNVAIAMLTLIICGAGRPALRHKSKGSKPKGISGKTLDTKTLRHEFKDFKLKGISGKMLDTKTLRHGKVLVLKFGATWCPYCVREDKELVNLRKEFGPADLVIGDVYVLEKPDTVAQHTKGLPFTVMLDQKGTVSRSFGVVGIPLVIIVDTYGKIVYRGNSTPVKILQDKVKRALANRKTIVPAPNGPVAGTGGVSMHRPDAVNRGRLPHGILAKQHKH